MSGYVSEQHDPLRVLTVVAITCRNCGGAETLNDESGRLSQCHICENGYEKLLVEAQELHDLCAGRPTASYLHRAIVRLAEARPVRLPVLTHCTSQLPVHLLPVKPRIVSQRIVAPIIITDKLEK